jgi:hypothetical protein
MRPPWAPPDHFTIRRTMWLALLTELRRRGRGQRESGAFLLAAPGERAVLDILYFDDLDPACLVGSIALDGVAFSCLWEYCEAAGLRVLGDVHTHPTAAVGLSPIDRANPMVAMAGHLGLIVPSYAEARVRRRDVGVHRYGGTAGWTSSFGWAAHRRIGLRR